MKKTIIALGCLMLLGSTNKASAQLETGICDISIYAQNIEWGVPFLQTVPVHPGLEIGANIMKWEKESYSHNLGLNAGYLYHDIIAQGIYAGPHYQFRYKVKDIFGIEAGIGAGLCYAFYAGDGYSYNEESGDWESGIYDRLFFQAHTGLGISYLGNDKVQPYLGYDLRMLQNIYNMVSHLKLGVRIKL